MPEVLVKTVDMDRDEWLRWRRRGIGGSDASAVAGLNRWRSPMQVWLEKTGQIPENADSEAMYWGRVLEDIVAHEFSKRTGKRLRRRNAILQHPEYPFMLANVDRLVVGEDAGLECKTASEWRSNEWANNGIPDEYLIQCQHYMAVTGCNKWYIAVLIGGNRFLWQEIQRDEDIIDYLIRIESDFWHLVETRTPPAIDGSHASTEALKLLYPESVEKTIELPHEAEQLIEERDRLKATIAGYEAELAAIENKLKAMLGEAEAGRIGNKLVTWKTVTSRRVDSKRLQKLHPDIYKECIKESSYRRFDVRDLRR